MSRSRNGGMVLEDGPAAGRYSVRRAPHFLRAVVGANARIDLLDQPSDAPLPDETVEVYEAVPGTTFDADGWARQGIFVCPPPGASGRYRHRRDVDGQQLRETSAWRAWARSQPAALPLLDVTTGEITPDREASP